MPLNKSTTYHQSVQFFVQFFSKKIVFLLSKKKNLKKFFLKFFLLSFTPNLLSFTTFYSVLPRLVLSFTKYPNFTGQSFTQLIVHQEPSKGWGCRSFPCLMALHQNWRCVEIFLSRSFPRRNCPQTKSPPPPLCSQMVRNFWVSQAWHLDQLPTSPRQSASGSRWKWVAKPGLVFKSYSHKHFCFCAKKRKRPPECGLAGPARGWGGATPAPPKLSIQNPGARGGVGILPPNGDRDKACVTEESILVIKMVRNFMGISSMPVPA